MQILPCGLKFRTLEEIIFQVLNERVREGCRAVKRNECPLARQLENFNAHVPSARCVQSTIRGEHQFRRLRRLPHPGHAKCHAASSGMATWPVTATVMSA